MTEAATEIRTQDRCRRGTDKEGRRDDLFWDIGASGDVASVKKRMTTFSDGGMRWLTKAWRGVDS